MFYTLALEMAERRTTNKMFQTDECEGQISTDYRESWIGTVYGTLFLARVDTNDGSTQAEFIVNLDIAQVSECDRGVEEGEPYSDSWARFGPRPGADVPKELLN